MKNNNENPGRMRRFLKSFTPYQTCYLTVVVLLVLVFTVFFPELILDETSSTIAVICSVITVLANPLCELLISKQSRLNFVVDFFLIELTYIIICLNQGWYTLLITVVCFWMPIDVISFLRWKKHPDMEDDNVTVVKRLRPRYAVLSVLAIVAFGLSFGYLMQFLPGSEDSYLEAFASAVGMANGILLMLRFHEQWLAWFITCILYVAMDISGGAYILLITEAAMLVNTVYGFVRWLIYTRRRKTVVGIGR